jgi:hypothetical protein
VNRGFNLERAAREGGRPAKAGRQDAQADGPFESRVMGRRDSSFGYPRL